MVPAFYTFIMEKKNYDYTDEDVISWFKMHYGIKKTRKIEYLDPRNYVIALLYQKFNYTEEDLASIFSIDRSTVSTCKFHAYTLLIECKDKNFIRNTKLLIEKFPYTFSDSNFSNKSKFVTKSINIKTLKPESYDKISKLSSNQNISKESFLVNLIENALKKISN